MKAFSDPSSIILVLESFVVFYRGCKDVCSDLGLEDRLGFSFFFQPIISTPSAQYPETRPVAKFLATFHDNGEREICRVLSVLDDFLPLLSHSVSIAFNWSQSSDVFTPFA